MSRPSAPLHEPFEGERERQQLPAQESWHRQTVEASPNPIFVLDAERRFQVWNPATEEVFGLSLLNSERLEAVLIAPAPDEVAVLVAQAFSGASFRNVSLTLRDAEEQPRHMKAWFYPLRTADDVVNGCVVACTDVSTLKATEAALQASQQRLALYFDQAPFAFVEWTIDGRILDWNPGAEDIFGYTREEALAMEVGFLVPEAERQTIAEVTLALVQNQGGRRSVNQNLTKNGRTIICSWYNTPVLDAKGRVSAVISLAHDLTEPLQISDALARSEERFRKLVQHASDSIAIVDADGIVRYNSPSALHVLGYAPEELVGQSVYALIHPEDRAAVRAACLALHHAPEQMTTVTYRLQHPQGDWIYVESVLNNLLDDPSIEGFIFTTRDVSAQRRYEQRLISAKETAEAAAAFKTALIDNISHEIRTPLTAILGFAEVLETEVPVAQQEFVELIRTSADRLLQMLNGVLDLAKLKAGPMPLEVDTLDLCGEVRSAITLFRPQAAKKGIHLVLECHTAPLEVRVDRRVLASILNNLLSNAVKFTNEGGVRVGVGRRADGFYLRVSDTGVGIGEAFMPFLFEEFKQESIGLTRRQPGSGLGLSITKQLVEQLGGTIEVESQKGKGSVFLICLPHLPEGRSPTAELHR